MEGRMVHLLYARKTLQRIVDGSDKELAQVAQGILNDPRLLIKYAAKRKERLMSKGSQVSA